MIMTKKEKEFLDKVLFVDPESGERMKMTTVEGSESGKDCLEITVKGKTTSYLHKIYTEEI